MARCVGSTQTDQGVSRHQILPHRACRYPRAEYAFWATSATLPGSRLPLDRGNAARPGVRCNRASG